MPNDLPEFLFKILKPSPSSPWAPEQPGRPLNCLGALQTSARKVRSLHLAGSTGWTQHE